MPQSREILDSPTRDKLTKFHIGLQIQTDTQPLQSILKQVGRLFLLSTLLHLPNSVSTIGSEHIWHQFPVQFSPLDVHLVTRVMPPCSD